MNAEFSINWDNDIQLIFDGVNLIDAQFSPENTDDYIELQFEADWFKEYDGTKHRISIKEIPPHPDDEDSETYVKIFIDNECVKTLIDNGFCYEDPNSHDY